MGERSGALWKKERNRADVLRVECFRTVSVVKKVVLARINDMRRRCSSTRSVIGRAELKWFGQMKTVSEGRMTKRIHTKKWRLQDNGYRNMD